MTTKIFTSLALVSALALVACEDRTATMPGMEDDNRRVCYKIDQTKSGPEVWRVTGPCPKNYSYTKK